jgi:hypothetical protein
MRLSNLKGKMKRFFSLAALTSSAILAQAPEDPVVLTIDIENIVQYRGNVFDASKIAKDPGPTTSAPQAFISRIVIGDITAVNGKPVKGVWSATYAFTTSYRSAPQPGQFIADLDLNSVGECTFQIYATDGTYLGLIRSSGGDSQAYTVTGGGGGFLGVVGTQGGLGETVPIRQASTAEDPANRRNLGGGKLKIVWHLYPRVRPAVQVTASGPSVFHADFSPVSSANPARLGETLILGATGLGPVKPNLLPPGAVEFSASPLQEVNAPVTVVFNGRELPAINKIGWPGQRHLYRVDFQVPSDASSGTATLQLVATWIPGPVVTIPVSAR